MSEPLVPTTHYAALVGVNSYPTDPLGGCAHDVREIAAYLGKLPVAVHIEIFTATQADNAQSSRPLEDSKSWPTYDNVMCSIKEISSLAKPGDFVLIYYSGHGTRIAPSAANKHFGDVAWVLLEGENADRVRYFRGVELAYLINDMVRKGLIVTIVLDCCFSGGVSRHDEQGAIRSLDYDVKVDADYPPDPMASLNLEAASDASRDGSMLPNWIIVTEKYTMLAACGPHEVAREIEFKDGKRHGILSYLLLRALLNVDISARTQLDIYNNIHVNFRQTCPQQTPVLYGNKDLRFFDSLLPRQSNLPISLVAKKASSLCLQGGEAHGICSGDVFTIYPFYSIGAERIKTERQLTARVTSVRALTSDLELLDPSQEQVVHTGWVARALTRVSLQQYPIQLSATISDPEKWLEASKERPSLAIYRTDSLDRPFSFQVALNNHSDFYEVRDESDRKIPNLPVVSSTHKQAIGDILDVIEHLARFKHVKAIANPQATEAFLRSFEITMSNCFGKGFDKGQAIEVKHNDIVVLEIENKSRETLYFHVYDLSSGWEVENLCRGSYEAIPARDISLGYSGLTRKKLKMTVPSNLLAKGYEECEDVIKVFVTIQPVTFATLEMPDINALKRMDASAVPIPSVDPSGSGRVRPDDWAASNFYIHTTV